MLFREPKADIEDTYGNKQSAMKQSNSSGNLADSSRTADHAFHIDNTTMRRNRSFWRFSKSEDILEGMALWKHRDLMPIGAEDGDKELTLKKPSKNIETVSNKMDANKSYDNTIPRERAKSMTKEMNKKGSSAYQEDEIYDESPKRRNDLGPSKSQLKNAKSKSYSEKYQDFYDDDDVVIKTVKRKEILKQYYSSGTDTELSSSDPYDCIVVDDHLVPSTSNFRNRSSYSTDTDKRAKTFSHANKVSGTLLPRTKLSRSSRAETTEANSDNAPNRNFEPWSNMWPDEKSLH